MLFNDRGTSRPAVVLAISQPAHALVSGQLLRARAAPLPEPVLVAAEQHDIAWLDWEVSPTFDPTTGRPHEFRAVGAAVHAPMWERGVARALAAWGRRAALLVSRHGSIIYERYGTRHRGAGTADDAAAQDYLGRHRALQETWTRALGLDPAVVASDAERIAFADTVSLVLCGALPAPLRVEVEGRSLTLAASAAAPDAFTLDPWPFAPDHLTFAVEARALPPSGRFDDEAAMRAWLAEPARVTAEMRLDRPSR